MAIDDFSEIGRIKIQELTVPSPVRRPEIPFDIKRDVLPDQWDKVKDKTGIILDHSLSSHVNLAEYKYLRDIATVAPEICASLVDDSAWRRIVWHLHNIGDDMDDPVDGIELLRSAAFLKLVDTERARSEELITDDQWKDIRSNFFNSGLERDKVQTVAHIKLHFPERAKEFAVTDDMLDGMLGQIEFLKNAVDVGPDNVFLLADLLAELKIIDPQKFKNLPINEDVWKKIWEAEKKSIESGMDEEVTQESVKRKIPQLGSNLITCMILSAKEIGVTPQGIKFVMPETETHETNLVPERRKF